MLRGLVPLASKAKSHRLGGGFFVAEDEHCWREDCIGGVVVGLLLTRNDVRHIGVKP